jgi:circadian clock protein KaiC
VLLQYVRSGSKLRRALTVIKSRGTAHDPRVYEFDITGSGIVLGGEVVIPDGREQPR